LSVTGDAGIGSAEARKSNAIEPARPPTTARRVIPNVMIFFAPSGGVFVIFDGARTDRFGCRRSRWNHDIATADSQRHKPRNFLITSSYGPFRSTCVSGIR
jgi:hypothetical protein